MPRRLLSDSALCSNGLIQVVQMRAQPAVLFHADIFAKRFDQFIMDFLFLTIGVLFQNLRNAHAVALLTIGQHAGTPPEASGFWRLPTRSQTYDLPGAGWAFRAEPPV